MVRAESILLYHSTDGRSLAGMRNSGGLFGIEPLDRENPRTLGSNLTPDKTASRVIVKTFETYSRFIDGLVTVEFELPVAWVKYVRRTPMFGCDEFATTLTVEARDISEDYFSRLDGRSHPFDKNTVVTMQDAGALRCYGVPFEFITKVEPVF